MAFLTPESWYRSHMSTLSNSLTPHRLSRRQFAQFGAAVAALFPARALAAVQSRDPELRSTLLMNIELDINTAESLGSRQIYPITGGAFDGPRLRGTALQGGGDWLIRRPDGTNELNARVTLQTDDEELIYLWHRGLTFTPESGDTYWRTTPVFETASKKYGWLNRIIAVGVGRSIPGKSAYRVFEIL